MVDSPKSDKDRKLSLVEDRPARTSKSAQREEYIADQVVVILRDLLESWRLPQSQK